MPLLAHFHDVHGQLQSSLSELQTRLNAVDVPLGGNMETIRSELHDAQVSYTTHWLLLLLLPRDASAERGYDRDCMSSVRPSVRPSV